MLRRARALMQATTAPWMGSNTNLTPILGRPPRGSANNMVSYGERINVEAAVVAGALTREQLSGTGAQWNWGPYNTEWRGDIYDELLKLPLRFALHPFDHITEAAKDSAVGYSAPLGPADPDDVIPFFVHRLPNGRLPGDVRSINPRILMPMFFINISHIEGDMWRFEEELIKIFPTKKTYVSPEFVRIYNCSEDGVKILHHWLVGLGF